LSSDRNLTGYDGAGKTGLKARIRDGPRCKREFFVLAEARRSIWAQMNVPAALNLSAFVKSIV
jgi:hypothetical protein